MNSLRLFTTCRHLLTFTCMKQALVGERFFAACRKCDFSPRNARRLLTQDLT